MAWGNLMFFRFCFGIIVFTNIFLTSGIVYASSDAKTAGVRVKDLVRVQGIRKNALTGYGLVVGLAGTGDSSRSASTIQAIVNTLSKFGMKVSRDDIRSRNVASVMITGTLPAFAEPGDNFDLHVSSIGDAKSLVGGTLLLTPMLAANDEVYALAQGQLAVGGYKFDAFGNVVQKNHPTVGMISKGATVEKETSVNYFNNGAIKLILKEPDFTTAIRISNELSRIINNVTVTTINASKIEIIPPEKATRNQLANIMYQIENITVSPDIKSKVVINERTGTVVSGGNVRISPVSISHGSLKLKITTKYGVSQPEGLFLPSDSIRTQVVPDTDINVNESNNKAVHFNKEVTIEELIEAFKAVNLSTRDTITILQSIKSVGALHAELIIQ